MCHYVAIHRVTFTCWHLATRKHELAVKANKGYGGVTFTSSSWPVHCYPGMSAVGDVYIHPKTTTKCRSPSLTTRQQKQWSHASYAFATSALIRKVVLAPDRKKTALIRIKTVFSCIAAFSKFPNTFLSEPSECESKMFADTHLMIFNPIFIPSKKNETTWIRAWTFNSVIINYLKQHEPSLIQQWKLVWTSEWFIPSSLTPSLLKFESHAYIRVNYYNLFPDLLSAETFFQ